MTTIERIENEPELVYSSDSDDDLSNLDLTDALAKEIENGEYTCLICTGEIDSHSKIWNCGVCWRVYDLDCIRDWSARGMRDKNNRVDGKSAWKCPSCNTPQFEPVERYTCWCGKMEDPPYNGLVPHSCGQTCNVKLGCVHGCSMMCHPGPHDECSAIGPALKCECGNHKKQLPCIITNYDGWKCNDICGEILPCGEHKCKRKCHDGLCGSCGEMIQSTCFCGKVSKEIQCCERQGAWSETNESKWIGYFSCGEVCDKYYDCGVHKCDKKCHSRQLDDHTCPMQPVEGEKCPCGKTEVEQVLGHTRQNCSEPIPNCSKSCSRKMKCGHECMAYCHTGECPPCRRILPIKCACGSFIYEAPCALIESKDKPHCHRRCTAEMSCRRHRCTQICCEYEQKALERERARKKKFRANVSQNNNNNNNEQTESIHQCQEVCNKYLNCGKHRCVMTCHHGPCRPCIESSPNDWRCPCGKTTLQAPIRCGSMLPTCKHPCTRDPPCGHPRIDHPCHDNNTSCPKCPYLMEKECTCGRSVIKGVMCHVEKVSCGKMCGELLKCGHKCQKVCHKEGECQKICKSACGEELPCGHIHQIPCHFDKPCEDFPKTCKQTVIITCKCEHLKKEEKCDEQPARTLECDDSCAIAERNRRLAEAFKIDLDAKHRADTHHEYNSDLLDIYHADPAWCDGIEEQFIQFVENSDMPFAKKTLKFPPMKSNRRQFIHMLAEEFSVSSLAQDHEPNRSVVIFNPHNGKIPLSKLRRYYNPWAN